jgi:hypothetical protein
MSGCSVSERLIGGQIYFDDDPERHLNRPANRGLNR